MVRKNVNLSKDDKNVDQNIDKCIEDEETF